MEKVLNQAEMLAEAILESEEYIAMRLAEQAAMKDEKATQFANDVNDTYIKVGGDERGTESYGAVCDLLVSWHIQQIVLPSQVVEDTKFDPYDESRVDLYNSNVG